MEFKAGDLVQLKSGGPTMTIGDIGKYGYDNFLSANCLWFSADEPKQQLFRLEMLKHVEPTK